MGELNLRNSSKTLQIILKIPGNGCNIDCEYCFEKEKRVSHEFFKPDLLDRIINKVDNNIVITFHGGEPLLIGKKRFIDLLEVIRQKPDKVDGVFIQSNGILLDEEWVDILYRQYKDLNIEMSLSLDGSESMNQLRVDYDGHGTFQRVIDSYELLYKHGIKAALTLP